ncbi:hypothetical protein [Elizabethkingia bruuniana]|uniref:hypothetical protein n=1 Tax=Elizabethkingia bruuniana TaxID=1756149 RepID=UPI00241F1112|nr:hypothetical protein [Elizabethkingia bruuniana]
MEKYYFLCNNWDFDFNQYSIFIGLATLVLTGIGFCIAICLYHKQRNDNAEDSYKFFISAIKNLNLALDDSISNFQEFLNTLRNGNLSNPSLNPSLNSNSIDKINILDLNRYYKNNIPEKLIFFEQFLNDNNFLISYSQYFTNELNYIRDNYLRHEQIFSQWNILNSNNLFSVMSNIEESEEFKLFYSNWSESLNNDNELFSRNANGNRRLNNRSLLISRYIVPLANNIFPYIQFSEKANEINLLANQISAAFTNMLSIENNMLQVFESDLRKFIAIRENIRNLTNH